MWGRVLPSRFRPSTVSNQNGVSHETSNRHQYGNSTQTSIIDQARSILRYPSIIPTAGFASGTNPNPTTVGTPTLAILEGCKWARMLNGLDSTSENVVRGSSDTLIHDQNIERAQFPQTGQTVSSGCYLLMCLRELGAERSKPAFEGLARKS